MTTSHVATRRAGRAPMLASLAVLVGAAACAGAAPSAVPATQSPALVTQSPAAATPTPAPASPSAAAALPPIPTKDGALEPGTYRMAKAPWSVADFSVTVPDGWNAQYGQVLGTLTAAGADLGLTASVPDHVWSKACAGSGSGAMRVGPTVDDLAAALAEQEDSVASKPVPTTIGGHDGVRVDLTVPDGFDLRPCNVEGIALQIWFNEPADANVVLFPDETVSAHIIDVDGKRQAFITQVPKAATDAERAELQAVLDSIRYDR